LADALPPRDRKNDTTDRDLLRAGRAALWEPLPKVFLRTLLFSTSKRGRVIESMHVALARNETHQNFNIRVYGDERLVRGSGVFVGETGVAANHHFLAPNDGSSFRFAAGQYRMDVFAKLLGDRRAILLFSQELEISREIGIILEEPYTGLYFDWGPDSSRYLAHTDKHQHDDQFLRRQGYERSRSGSRESS